MSLRSYVRKLMGQAGKASRSKRGASSHINTWRNKRQANKSARYSYRAALVNQELEDAANALVKRWDGVKSDRYVSMIPNLQFLDNKVLDTYLEDHHLDVPDEIKGDRDEEAF